MSKKILIISASPRKGGNSDLLCDEFMRGAIEVGHETEKIRLSEKTINYCTGCCACIAKQGACVQQDDMTGILQKMLAADVMVFATPVYFHAMNGQLKTFIDRVCPIYTMISNKEVYFVVTAAGGEGEIEHGVQSLRVFTDTFSNITERGVMGDGGVWNVGEVKKSPSLKQAYAMGKNA